MGFSPRERRTSPFTANSDIAFWGRLAIHGNYHGFRLIDIAEADNPVQLLGYRDCAGNQGDVLVWDNLVIRSWNSPHEPERPATGRWSSWDSKVCTSSISATGCTHSCWRR
jgi:hypothetical protein